MQLIKYNFLPDAEGAPVEKAIRYSEHNLEIARREAYNGEYTIIEDEEEAAVILPSNEERIAALEDALLEMLMGE